MGNIFLGYLHFQEFWIYFFGVNFHFQNESVISSSIELWGVLLLYIYRKRECLADYLTIKLNCEIVVEPARAWLFTFFCKITCQAYRSDNILHGIINDVCYTFLLHKARNPRIFWLNFLQLWEKNSLQGSQVFKIVLEE